MSRPWLSAFGVSLGCAGVLFIAGALLFPSVGPGILAWMALAPAWWILGYVSGAKWTCHRFVSALGTRGQRSHQPP